MRKNARCFVLLLVVQRPNWSIFIMNDVTLREIPLGNGLSLEVRETARRYFGDYFTVQVEFECRIPLERRFFEDDSSFEAFSGMANPVHYRRTIQRTGVPSSRVATAKEEIIGNFLENAQSYLSSPLFPRKVIEAGVKNRSIRSIPK